MNRFLVAFQGCCLPVVAIGAVLASTLGARAQDAPTASHAPTAPLAPRIPWSATPLAVAMDGTLNDAAWQQAAVATGFINDQAFTPAAPQTTARIMADAAYLYVGMTAREPAINKLVHNVKARQDALWNDDCVEFFLDPTHSGAWMYHWIVNPNGQLWEGLVAESGGAPNFRSDATAAAHIGTDGWTCELRIPWKELMMTPGPGQWLGINFTRERKAGGTDELSSWTPSNGSFTDPQVLSPALLGSPDGVTLVSVGSGAADFNGSPTNRLTLNVASAAAPVRAEVLAGGKVIGSGRADAAGLLAVDYATPAAATLTFRVSRGANILLARTLTAPTPTARVWQVPDPLYQTLLGSGPAGPAREGVLVWSHNLVNVKMLRETARRLGLEYDLSEMYRQAGREQMRIFGLPPAAPGEAYDAWKNSNVKYVYMIAAGEPWSIDPKVVDSAMRQLDAVLTRDQANLWAIEAGDEVITHAQEQGAALMAKPPADYPFLQQADDEVRTQFGGGKWGIPHGKADPNPYRWIAYTKWLNLQYHKRALRVREIMQKHHCDLPFISFDPTASAAGNDYSVIAADYDMFTHQTYQQPNAWRANTGFFTKILVDLTGKDVWPCVHLENYAMATTPAEAREEMSEVFRNGGSGFHFYLPDTADGAKLVGDTRLCYFGSPRRYNTILNVIDLTRTMPKPRYPGSSRTAILYHDDMLQSTPANHTAGPATEACYTFLGPVARSWFSFIDDSQVLATASLNQRFDVIYLPTATYMRPEIISRLHDFVENGGTLVCGDASAFSTDTLGNDTSDARRQLFGVETSVGQDKPTELRTTLNGTSYALRVIGNAVHLEPLAATRALGAFDDGSAAITEHSLGRGKAILFSCNPFRYELLSESQWRAFFTAWAAYLNAPMGLDIWRFQFPDSVLGKDKPVPAGLCLTNNHVTWREEKAITLGNADVKGSYRVQPAPDAMPDAAGDARGWISFAEGHLTDRRRSMLDPKVAPKWYVGFTSPDSRWMDSWNELGEVTLTFDLQKPMVPGTLRFWFDDTMPRFAVEGSNDLQQWQPLGANREIVQAGADVREVDVPLHGSSPCRYVRVNFAARQSGEKLTLVESELWDAGVQR